MFCRTKVRRNKGGSTVEYLQIVESVREEGKIRQRIICTLGRLDELKDRDIARLAESLQRFSREKGLASLAKDALSCLWSRPVGPAWVMRRLFETTGLVDIVTKERGTTKIAFDAKEAIFAMMLNRLMDPCSKRQVSEWAKEDVYEPSFATLELQHYYRALDFLADHKDTIEEELFARTRDLFNQELSLVFFDTTTTYFEGTRAQPAAFGYSKDHRPDRLQVVIGLLVDASGTPIAHQVLPGGTADMHAFLDVIKACTKRFNLTRIVMVGDRGMANVKTVKALEEAGYEYILGVKMRRGKEVHETVLSRAGRFRKVDETLEVKNVEVNGRRYVICHNPEEARRDAEVRKQVIVSLEKKLAHGIKPLIGNRMYARYLTFDKEHASLNRALIDDEARYDGKYVLMTNTALPTEDVARAYKQLWMVEHAFREMKSNLDLRPVYHFAESRIRGHIMVCFLAFYLETIFRRRLAEVAPEAQPSSVLMDLARLNAVKIKNGDKTAVIRTELTGDAHLAFRAARLQVPPRVLQT
jgi:transposase